MRGFKFLTGDVNYLDYGAKWYRVIPGTNDLRYHVIELINWEDAVGRDAEGGPTYNMDLSEIDLGAISEETIRQAIDSCGWLDEDDLTELAIVEACHGYGCKAPLWNEDGNNFRELMAEAKRQSRELDDPEAHEVAMQRPVNRLGETASEFMRGDLWSALRRAKENPTPDQALVLRMYGACSHTLGGEPIPPDIRLEE